MNNNLLITAEEMRDWVRLPKSVHADQIDFAVRAAQDEDLQEFLGQEMYYDMLTNISLTKYQDLLNGKVYTNSAGYSVNYPGLKAVISFYAYARYVSERNVQDTEHGLVVKKNDFSDPVDSKAIALKVANARASAGTYQERASRFLVDNSNDYPLWWGHKKPTNTTGYKVRAAKGGAQNYTTEQKSKYRC